MASRNASEESPAVELSAVIVGSARGEPQVLVVRPAGSTLDALPSGPLESAHRTLEAGLRSWVERQTSQPLGYVEQLYTFGDRDRASVYAEHRRPLSIGYLALARELKSASGGDTAWRSWYRYFPWEDWRGGKPAMLAPIETELRRWISSATGLERKIRDERARTTFALGGAAWSEERTLERYELLYQVGLAPEASRATARPRRPAPRGWKAKACSPITGACSLRPLQAARQDQVPPRRVRADAAHVHVPGAAACRRGLSGLTLRSGRSPGEDRGGSRFARAARRTARHGADAVLLDNMTVDQMREAVKRVREHRNGARMLTEASGGITPESVGAIAATGVDLISSGWITHSAPALDLGLDAQD
jgi:ADP-ribose pyrophosphatase YjhB (NUDIX family)